MNATIWSCDNYFAKLFENHKLTVTLGRENRDKLLPKKLKETSPVNNPLFSKFLVHSLRFHLYLSKLKLV